jgi:hypothetical protein
LSACAANHQLWSSFVDGFPRLERIFMRRTFLVLSTALVALLLPLAGTSGAGITRFFDYSPQSGPPGTVISASGNCSDFLEPVGAPAADGPSGLVGTVTVELRKGATALDTVTEPMNVDGTWAIDLTVPAGTAAGDYDLAGECFFPLTAEGRPSAVAADAPAGIEPGVTYVYGLQPFTVTAQPTSTTAGQPTSTTAGPTSTTRPAVAAQAVRAAPSFTG